MSALLCPSARCSRAPWAIAVGSTALPTCRRRVFKGIFKKGGSGPPPWLEGIVNDAYGRQLVYDLSSRHRTCLLLNFAIQRILSLGFAREVRAWTAQTWHPPGHPSPEQPRAAWQTVVHAALPGPRRSPAWVAL